MSGCFISAAAGQRDYKHTDILILLRYNGSHSMDVGLNEVAEKLRPAV